MGVAASVAACGSSDSGSTAAAIGGAAHINGAKVIDPNAMKNAKGTITYCTPKDTTGDQKAGVAAFNAQYAGQGLKARLLEFPAAADEARNQFVQRETAKTSQCDIMESDVVWTAEFASQKWLYDLTPYLQQRRHEFLSSTLEPVHYAGKYWAVPRATDTGLLFYRTDQVKQAPATWQQLYQDAGTTKGITYQGAAYEGLTCDFLELAFAAGGDVLSADGSKSVIDSPQNLAALKLMVDGIHSGAASKAVTTYQEEDARRAFEAGKATFMRNWPYAYALGEQAPKVKGKFAVAPLPSFAGAGKAGILGGHNMVISAYSKNPGAALKLVDWFTSAQTEKQDMIKYARASVLSATYDDAAVQKAVPFAAALRDGVAQAKSRPVSPVYPQISEAISKNVNAALSGSTSPEQALKTADKQISSALSTF
ncbi:ABC transporter substrate-binding protein [Baekduia alba]|uniref:ABC transporter substrate-binding protein n=1 Tax=Baekduia alba TaxID=2997333 RepID=UPI0023416CEC|nr:ABC transporter substrate-binding protein [Baekduia alba]